MAHGVKEFAYGRNGTTELALALHCMHEKEGMHLHECAKPSNTISDITSIVFNVVKLI